MGTIANRKSLSAKVIALLTSVALVLSFIPCMALPQMALADDAASGEATVFTVYTTDNAGNNKQVAKVYTQAELEALVDSSADAIAGQYVKGGSMGVWASDSYVTFADLLAGAGAAWGAGCTAKWGGTPEKPGNAFAYEQLQGRQFLPAAAVDKETGDITFSAAEIEGMNPAGKPYWTGTNSITIVAPPVFTVSTESFANGYYKVTYTEGVFEGTIIAMNGEDMFRDSETQEFVALVTKEQADALKNASFTVTDVEEGGVIPVVYRNGDMNDNGKINIVDAQISYDLACGVCTDFAQVSMKQWLAGDVNNDGVLDAADAFAIQYKVHHGAFAAE